MSPNENLPSRVREICEGRATDLSLEKINKYREAWGLPPLTGYSDMAGGIVPPPFHPRRRKPVELGDAIEKALSSVGITSERVSKWLGRPCGCKARKERLNQLSRWAKRVISGEKEPTDNQLEEVLRKQ